MKKKIAAICASTILLTTGIFVANPSRAMAATDGWGCNISINNSLVHPTSTSSRCPNYIKKYRAVARCWSGQIARGPWVANKAGASSKAQCFVFNVTDAWTDVIY